MFQSRFEYFRCPFGMADNKIILARFARQLQLVEQKHILLFDSLAQGNCSSPKDNGNQADLAFRSFALDLKRTYFPIKIYIIESSYTSAGSGSVRTRELPANQSHIVLITFAIYPRYAIHQTSQSLLYICIYH